MTTITTPQRAGAMLLALACLAGTTTLLYADVLFAGVAPTIDHVVSALVLAVALLAGHFAWPMVRARLVIPGVGLGIVAVAALMLVISGSAGRKAEIDAVRTRVYAQIERERERISADIADARADHAKAKAAEAGECVKVGTQCDRKTARRLASWQKVEVLEAKLDRMTPTADGGGPIRAFARAVAIVPGVTMAEAEIERRMTIGLPYLLAIVFEIGFLTAMHVVLASPAAASVRQPLPETVADPVIPAVPARTAPATVSSSAHRRQALPAAGDVQILLETLRDRDCPLDNATLARLMGVTEGEASKRVTAAVQAGLARRLRTGRRVAVTLH